MGYVICILRIILSCFHIRSRYDIQLQRLTMNSSQLQGQSLVTIFIIQLVVVVDVTLFYFCHRSSTSLEKTDNKIILGQGAYGIVYEDTWNGRKVAVKRIQLFETTSKREEEALKKLDHPNVVKLFHVDKDKDFK